MPADRSKTAAAASQFGLALSGDDPAAVQLGPADRSDRRQRRDGLRSDARRTLEFLASRGRTPIEALHDVVKLGWKDGTRTLAKELGIGKAEAFRLWRDIAEGLLPYTAPTLDGLDLGAALGAGAAAGSAGLAHYLAASALGAELARDRAALPGVAMPSVSRDIGTLDDPKSPGLASVQHELSISVDETVSRLPPRGSD
jgi:hypothetical protein